jgi:hypothetical protein
MQANLAEDAAKRGDGYLVAPITAELFKVNAGDAAWVDKMCVKHPLACFQQKISLTGEIARTSKRAYVLATNWGPPQPFVAIAERLRNQPGWRVASLPCGHDVMLDMPQETAELLTAAST